MKLIFASRKEANAFKRSSLHGVETYNRFAYALRELIPSLLMDEEVPDDYIVDIDSTKAQPVKKEEEVFVIECVQYIPKPKTRGVAVC